MSAKNLSVAAEVAEQQQRSREVMMAVVGERGVYAVLGVDQSLAMPEFDEDPTSEVGRESDLPSNDWSQ